MYEFMIDDESRPLPERKAWMVLSHVPSVHGMRIDSIERCVTTAEGHEVVIRSDGSLWRVTVDRDYSNPRVERQEMRLPERGRRPQQTHHSRAYERLGAQLFPTLA